MSSIKELQNHIKSVRDMQKITQAMQLISSAKLRRAKNDLAGTRPYFEALHTEIKRLFRIGEQSDSIYLYPVGDEHDLPGDYAYLVITADKGLAGAYNQNVLAEAEKLIAEPHSEQLYVVGEYGRQYFMTHGHAIEKSFLYTAQNPTLGRAREIADILLEKYRRKEVSKIFVIYTDFSGRNEAVHVQRLLPFHRADYVSPNVEKAVKEPFEFEPSVEKVLEGIIDSYVAGFIYSALIDSYCSEQSARMEAMNGAKDNATELLNHLSMAYHHTRQSAITKEITEICAGYKGARKGRE